MSTRATIYYDRHLHIYDELMDGRVHFSYRTRIFEFDVVLPRKAIQAIAKVANRKPRKLYDKIPD